MALIKERTKKRKGENVIGKIIYGFLLFAPLMVIAFTSLYAVLNKNAFESYYGETINETTYDQCENLEDLQIGKSYKWQNEQIPLTRVTGSFILTISNFNSESLTVSRQPTRVDLYSYPSNGEITIMYMVLRDNDGYITERQINSVSLSFNFILEGYTSGSNNYVPFISSIYRQENNQYSYLDNNFEYGCYKAENSTLFNWAKNTGTYDVLETTTTGLGITNTFIPFLMAYWLLISVIYFIFDIALILIWMVHDKIHELKDSIEL